MDKYEQVRKSIGARPALPPALRLRPADAARAPRPRRGPRGGVLEARSVILHYQVTSTTSKGTLPTYSLVSMSTNFLASWELVKELVRVSRVSRPSPRNLLKLYEDPSDHLARHTGKNSTVVCFFGFLRISCSFQK